MGIKKSIYISGPRMGTNNLTKGIELPFKPVKKTKLKKTRRKYGDKKR